MAFVSTNVCEQSESHPCRNLRFIYLTNMKTLQIIRSSLLSLLLSEGQIRVPKKPALKRKGVVCFTRSTYNSTQKQI